MVCPHCHNDTQLHLGRCVYCGKEINTNKQLDSKFDSAVYTISGISTMVVGGLFTLIASSLLYSGSSTSDKIIMVPFLICGIAILISGFGQIRTGVKANKSNMEEGLPSNNQISGKNIENLGKKIYAGGFLLFWFGFLCVYDYASFQQWNEGGDQMFIFSLIFWAAGIFVLYDNFIKKKK